MATSIATPGTTTTRPYPQWRIWKVVDNLLKQESSSSSSSSSSDKDNHFLKKEPFWATTAHVATLLQQWGHQWAGQPAWASLLNKRTLYHEVEESIVALHYLHEWLKHKKQDVVAVDVCGGKGLLAMLLSYMATVWQKEMLGKRIKYIVLLEKVTASEIDWHHIHQANARLEHEGPAPRIAIWDSTNLHEYDLLLDRFQQLSAQQNAVLALTGIHLCKMLSPSFVSLVNGLGPQTCPYFCLSPCCLPRKVTSHGSNQCIPIFLRESLTQRAARLDHNQRKQVAISRNRKHRVCYHCQSTEHWVRACPLLVLLSKSERQEAMYNAVNKTPCWNCGLVGHFKSNCPTPLAKVVRHYPPSRSMDLSHILDASDPYESYCQLLSRQLVSLDPETDETEPVAKKRKTCGGGWSIRVRETGLTAVSGHHEDKNWNARRKSIYIVGSWN